MRHRALQTHQGQGAALACQVKHRHNRASSRRPYADNESRLSLTLPPHRYDLITRLATLQGVSRAYLVNDMLEEIYPVLERVCVVLEAAKQSQASVKHGLREAAQQAEDELVPLAQSVLGQFDLFMERVQTEVLPRVASGMGGGDLRSGAPLSIPPGARPGSHLNGTFPEGPTPV